MMPFGPHSLLLHPGRPNRERLGIGYPELRAPRFVLAEAFGSDCMSAKKKAARKTVKKKVAKKSVRKKPARKPVAKRELIDTGTNKLYVRRNARGTSFKEVDDVGRSLTTDRRRKAKTVAKRGQGDKGDRRR